MKKNKKNFECSLMDGYVDIKSYKVDKDNNLKLVYHDTGDNSVTVWAKQVILEALCGRIMSKNGSEGGIDSSNNKIILPTKMDVDGHTKSTNKDGYCLNSTEYQYKFEMTDELRKQLEANFQPFYNDDNNDDEYKYAMYPTKVIFGTGKEYSNFEEINNEIGSVWWNNIVEDYGAGDSQEAQKQIDNLIDSNLNLYSARDSSHNKQAGEINNNILLDKTITLNAQDNSSVINNPAELFYRFGVEGAIKTLYLPGNNVALEEIKSVDSTINDFENLLNTVTSDSGRLLRSNFRGVGFPCFIYFSRKADDDTKPVNIITLKKENTVTSKAKNLLTFTMYMPSQKENEYYPYNGYLLKEVGLFNDSYLQSTGNGGGADYTLKELMPGGTMLAIKNIAPFTKTAENIITLTWTLSI